MRHYVVAVFGIFSLATACIAQDATNADNAANPTTSILIARTGESFQSPHVGTYHLVEFFQLRGKWIYPDVGYIDFGTNNYHEVFVGGGRTTRNGRTSHSSPSRVARLRSRFQKIPGGAQAQLRLTFSHTAKK